MLNFSQMSALCSEVNNALASSIFTKIGQEAEKKWLLFFEHQGEKFHLLISLKKPFCRFHLSTRHHFIQETPFTKELEKLLQGACFQEAALLGQDRILQMKFEKDSKIFYLLIDFVPRQLNFYVLAEDRIILLSEGKTSHLQYPIPKTAAFSLEKINCVSKQVDEEYEKKERAAFFEEEKEEIRKDLLSTLKKLKKRYANFLQEAEEGKRWEEEKHTAELLQTYFFLWKKGMNNIELEDWLQEGKKVFIVLDPLKEPSDDLKKRFVFSQKLKRKEEASLTLAKRTKEEIDALELRIKKLDEAKELDELTLFQKLVKEPTVKKVEKKKEHPFREFTTESGLKIFVGKKDTDNEKLTFSFARGLDIWLHASGVPGSHVILQKSKKEPPDQEALLDAMQIALHFSKAGKEMGAEVIVTECKNVQKAKKGKLGQVTISHHKKVWVKRDPVRLNRLFSKLLPGQALP